MSQHWTFDDAVALATRMLVDIFSFENTRWVVALVAEETGFTQKDIHDALIAQKVSRMRTTLWDE